MDQVREIKKQCLSDPEKHLWIATKDILEVKHIFRHLEGL